MGIIEDLRNRVVTFNDQLADGLTIKQIIWDNEAYIIDLNAEEQLFEQGVNNLGVSISDYMPYTDLTIEIKEQKGQPTDRVTLHDEGDFAASIYLEVGDDQFLVKAADFKTEELIKKYGRQILGLTDESLATVIWSYIYPDLLAKAQQTIYGTD